MSTFAGEDDDDDSLGRPPLPRRFYRQLAALHEGLQSSASCAKKPPDRAGRLLVDALSSRLAWRIFPFQLRARRTASILSVRESTLSQKRDGRKSKSRSLEHAASPPGPRRLFPPLPHLDLTSTGTRALAATRSTC